MAARYGPGPAFHAAPPAPPSAAGGMRANPSAEVTSSLAGQKSKRRRPRKPRSAAAVSAPGIVDHDDNDDDDEVPVFAGAGVPLVRVAAPPSQHARVMAMN